MLFHSSSPICERMGARPHAVDQDRTAVRGPRREWLWAVGWSLIALLGANLPYLVGTAISTPESRFGGLYFIVEDGNSYLAKMRHAALDGWRTYLPYSHESASQQGGALLLYLLYTLLGKGVRLVTGGAPVPALLMAYHAARVFGGLALCLMVYRFIAHWVEGTMRRLAFALALFALGWGWLLALLGRFGNGDVPLEFWAPDAFPLAILSGPPHIILAVPMLLGAVLATMRTWRTAQWKSALGAAILCLALALTRPEYVLVFEAVAGTAWCIEAWRQPRGAGQRLVRLLPAAILPVPILLYLLLALYRDPVLSQWTSQNPFVSPSPWHYLAGYGLLLLPALWGLRQRAWWRTEDRWILLLWIALAPLLAYAPFQAQRRLIGGVQVPLAMAAARGLWQEGRRRNWQAWAWFVLAAPGSLFFALGGTAMVIGRPDTLFHSADEQAALAWLATHCSPDDLALTAMESGNLIPVYADCRVLLGHPIETIQFAAKEADVASFYDARTPSSTRWEILRRYGITLVYQSPWDRTLGEFDPSQMPGLRPLYTAGHYRVFQVEDRPDFVEE